MKKTLNMSVGKNTNDEGSKNIRYKSERNNDNECYTSNKQNNSDNISMLYVKEIHHRIKNQLQILSGMIYLKLDEIKDEQVRNGIIDIYNKIGLISQLHEMMCRMQDNSSLNGKISGEEYIKNVCEITIQIYKTNSKKVIMHYNVDKQIKLDFEKAYNIGLICNEIITNSVKYAFVNKLKSLIAVKAFLNENENIILIIQDNGIGIETDNNNKAGDTFGKELVYALIKQMGGNCTINFENGTCYTITIPM